ncbi:MAG: HTTM domain-containing protein [Kordiimonadaceae bacterium]|nr:HTTM domain-containing protein [Kordiimonadaceae bacterium]
MTLETALRATEVLLALAFLQQSIEHLAASKTEVRLFVPRIFLSFLLLIGFMAPWVCLALVVLSLLILKRFQGPYNGGSDRMSLLILCCLTLAQFMPRTALQEVVFGYLALQLVLSYFISGWVKVANPDWRSGKALRDVFRFSAYPVSQELRLLSEWPRLLFVMSWSVMLFELLFPFALSSHTALIVGLGVATVFHLANACIFGLNRFFWIWLAAYPSLIWFQERIFIA